MNIIGRMHEQQLLQRNFESNESKLIAVYGRRRVGKTFLIREYYNYNIILEIAGLHKGNMQDQLLHFYNTLAKHKKNILKENTPKTWMQAFALLEKYLDGFSSTKKKVVFIDELPWFDTARSKFLMAFENFWNSYCTKRKDLVVVVCGSAASWMIKNIMKNKGGLHNRISEKIKLTPFNLYETELFLKNNNIKWSKYDIAQLYMVTGGIPHYLKFIIKGESLNQFVDRVCFRNMGALQNEFNELYASLFDNSEMHYKVIYLLATKVKGLFRNELIELLKIESGGTVTKIIDELTESGFITKYIPIDNISKQAMYKLSDQFTVFYLKFMHHSKALGAGAWLKLTATSSYKAWSGFAFENICQQHIEQIKLALKLEAIYTETGSWHGTYEGNAAQIDIVIDRADRVINLCEVKFNSGQFIINKIYAQNLRNKINVLQEQLFAKNKNIFLTMITVNGIRHNQYSNELMQNEIVLEDLFK
jgi:uncharacterized protein